jgi:flagellar biosynthesis protein FlhB
MAQGSGGDKTEKATPKKRDEARRKGQVARSMDLNGAAVLMAALLALAAWGPRMTDRLQVALRDGLLMIRTPERVSGEGLSDLLVHAGTTTAIAVAPIAFTCLIAGVLASVLQVGIKPMPGALKPNFRKLDPVQGAKNIFGMNAVFETGKSLVKIAVVGAIAAYAVIPKIPEVARMVGLPPADLLTMLARDVFDIAKRAALAYLVIAICDYAYQRWRHEKQLRMDKEEVKDESKQQSLPGEVKTAQRKRQIQAARARMMVDVPHADVVVTNPTHFAVALKYDPAHPAPTVVAKGQDLIALQIRKVAAEHGVPVLEDKPLARALHSTVELGQVIPEQFFQAVAQLLAFVYRTAGRRAS